MAEQTETISLRLSTEVMSVLKAVAAENKRPLAQMARVAVEEWLQQAAAPRRSGDRK